MKNYLAFDLGATSGCAVIGRLGYDISGRESHLNEVELMEIYRFPNTLVQQDGHLYWNFEQLFSEIKTGLNKAAQIYRSAHAIGFNPKGMSDEQMDELKQAFNL
ncbi:MAG: hypothetical protein MJZ88_04075 [Paludibacteraceae bacterium]|nr:hypothetical protein [Paludibacteraceae bacterium]